jgi:hypothetical protein
MVTDIPVQSNLSIDIDCFPLYLHHTLMKQCQHAEQFMLTLSEHQTIQPVLVGVYMARALVLVVFVSN